MSDENQNTDLLGMTADIISAYVGNNSVNADALPGLISSVHAALSVTSAPVEEPVEQFERPTSAQIRKSVTPDAIISFENGKSYKSMKRSLALLGLTPAEYREKWGLPKDYPMVAPNYAAARSSLAKSMGLGSGGRKPAGAKTAKAKATKAKASAS